MNPYLHIFSSFFLTVDLFLVAFFMTIIYINLGLKICLSYNRGLTSLSLEELLNINLHFFVFLGLKSFKRVIQL